MPPPSLEECTTITDEDVGRAIRLAGASAPGPDGIPYSYWKGIAKTGEKVLADCIRSMAADDGIERMTDGYASVDDRFGECDFNASLLVLLPKKASGNSEEMGEYYAPENTRPLMLVDTSNRILASTLRIKMEKAIGQVIGPEQHGFLHDQRSGT